MRSARYTAFYRSIERDPQDGGLGADAVPARPPALPNP
jgi:hypothetical protein